MRRTENILCKLSLLASQLHAPVTSRGLGKESAVTSSGLGKETATLLHLVDYLNNSVSVQELSADSCPEEI